MQFPVKADLLFSDSKELLEELKGLGFSRAVCCYTDPKAKPSLPKVEGLEVRSALLLKDRNAIGKARNRYDILIGPPTREFFEDKRVDGFYLGDWLMGKSLIKRMRIINRGQAGIKKGTLESTVARRIPLDNLHDGLLEYTKHLSDGKAVLILGSS